MVKTTAPRHGLEPINSEIPEVEVGDADIVRGTNGALFAIPRPVEPPKPFDPFADAVPTAEDVDRLVAEQAKAYEYLNALTVEEAAIPSLWEEAITNGDAGEMARLQERKAKLPHELTLAGIALAKSRLAVCQARYSIARKNRDDASAKLNELGPMAGYPEGRDSATVAGERHNSATMMLSEAGIALAEARRNLDSTLAAAGGR